MKLLTTAFTLCISLISNNLNAMQCMHDKHPVAIKYLGIGALDIHYKNQRILTDPYYSPQSLWDIVTLEKYKSDKNAIIDALGAFKRNVNNVLIGHGHYDHLADLPAIKNYLTEDAVIIGSKTASNMIRPVFNTQNLMSISEGNEQQWVYIANGWVRIRAKLSEHAPQFMSYNFAPDTVEEPRKKLPRYIWSWKQGKNLSFIIDFLEEKKSNNVYKRIFIQSSASNFPAGYQELKDDIKVDAIFIAAASFENVKNYPSSLINHYNPKYTYLIHWENFFKPWFKKPTLLSSINVKKLIKQSKAASNGDVMLATPDDCLYL